MRKTLLTLSILLTFSFIGNTQCTPNQIFTMSPIPGVYPPNIPISGIPLVGISDGQINIPYSQTLTLVVLEDTTMDIDFLLDMIDPAITPLMNSAGISTTMNVDVNHVIYDIAGLPNNLTYTCDINSCQYPSGVNGCIAISGTPIQSGTFPIDVNMTINVQIPAITIPVVGTVIYPGSGQDIPSFSAVAYDLLVIGTTAITEVGNYRLKIFPNPTSYQAILSLIAFSDVVVYNILGEKVLIANNVKGDLVLSKNDIGKGVFYISVQSKNKTETIKLIIK